MKKLLNTFIKIVPIIFIGIVLLSSAYLFEQNKNQTYERIKNLKESQIQIIAEQVDTRVQLTGQDFSVEKNNQEVLKRCVESINEQSGVYCYLFTKDCELISDFSKQQKHEIGEAFIASLRDGSTIKVVLDHGYHGCVTTEVNGKEFEVYWQGLPTTSRDNCEYFIILSVNRDEIQQNEAISSCKIFIGGLSILLGISMYYNIYIDPIVKKEKK